MTVLAIWCLLVASGFNGQHASNKLATIRFLFHEHSRATLDSLRQLLVDTVQEQWPLEPNLRGRAQPRPIIPFPRRDAKVMALQLPHLGTCNKTIAGITMINKLPL